MKIEHTALYVKNLEREKAFFEKYFSAESGEKYLNGQTGFESYFLYFDGGGRLELMSRRNLEDCRGDINRTGFIHIAFSVGGRKTVDALSARLLADGYAVLSNPRVTGDGYYESVVLDPEGNQIEITE